MSPRNTNQFNQYEEMRPKRKDMLGGMRNVVFIKKRK